MFSTAEGYENGYAYEDGLRHEGEVLSPPEVAVVYTSHEDVREEDTDVLVDLQPNRVEHAVTADQVPVEAPRKQTHALVVAGAAEDVPEHLAVVVGQAEDRNTGEQREDPCKSRGVSISVGNGHRVDRRWTYTVE